MIDSVNYANQPLSPGAVDSTDSKQPYTDSWNATISQRTPWSGLWELSYVGNRSRDLSSAAGYGSDINMVPVGALLSANNGGVGLSATTWPRIWFKGGSEPGVLTLGYLARDSAGGTFVVIVLTEDQAQPVQESLASEIQGLNGVTGTFNLLRAATQG